MNVSRDVILDLLPLYLAGEASTATRELVETHLKEDPELAQKLRLRWAENFRQIAPSTLSPDLELKSLRRTRGLLGLRQWCFGFAIAFTSIALAIRVSFHQGHLAEFRPMLLDYPGPLGTCLLLGIACWISYALLRRRLRGGGF